MTRADRERKFWREVSGHMLLLALVGAVLVGMVWLADLDRVCAEAAPVSPEVAAELPVWKWPRGCTTR